MKRLILVSLFLAGCMVGPNYRPPDDTMPATFHEAKETECILDEDLAIWWERFEDPHLNSLIAESLENNFDYKIALEKIIQARAVFWVDITAILPELDADASVTRSRTSQTLNSTAALSSLPGMSGQGGIPPIQNFYQAGFDAIWQIDLFGGLRRAAKAAFDLWEASIWDARGIRVTMVSEIATTYTTIRALQQHLELAKIKVESDQEILKLANIRFSAGLTDLQEVQQAIAQLDTDQATFSVIDTNLKGAIYSLGILLGRKPETLLCQFQETAKIPTAGQKVPGSLPCDLLRRRPDIRRAERYIAAATEQIGVAIADLFPKFSLTGSSSSFAANPLQGANYGYSSNQFKQWFETASRIWGIGILAQMPIFDFGKRLAGIQEQYSLKHQAFFSYEKTVVSALQEVETGLNAYFNEETRNQHLKSQVEASYCTYQLTEDLYQAGLTSYSQLLKVKQTWIDANTNLITSEQNLTNDLIALYKALGGGW
jgi:outer membrane protein, multidrug efflux system